MTPATLILLGTAVVTLGVCATAGSLLAHDSVAVASTLPLAAVLRRRRGRPRKFAAPSRAVTVTLPESVLSALSSVHEDLSHAIAQTVQRHVTRPSRSPAPPLAELITFGHQAVIAVRPTPSLERRAGVELLPLPDGSAIMTLDRARTVAELELALRDLLEDRTIPRADHAVIEAVLAILKDARLSKNVTLVRKNIIVLQSAVRSRQRR